MMSINLNRIFKARGIEQPYKFLIKAGFVSFMAHKLKNNSVQHIRVEHIEKLCIALNCTPNDLFEWSPNDLLDDRINHPLQKIRAKNQSIELNKLLAGLPLERLETIKQLLVSQ